MAWVGLSISGSIDRKRGSASNNERTTRQNTPAGCQIGPAGVISVCGKYPHTYTRIQISGKSRTHASKLPAGLAGFCGGGMAQVMQLSGTQAPHPPNFLPVACSGAQAAKLYSSTPERRTAPRRGLSARAWTPREGFCNTTHAGISGHDNARGFYYTLTRGKFAPFIWNVIRLLAKAHS